MTAPDPLTLTLERPAFGGRTVGRLPDGRVCFVRGGAPGDTVEIALTASKKRHAEADVVRLVASGADRVQAFCPMAGTCGGCPWQIIDRGAQLKALKGHLAHTLGRAASGQAGAEPIIHEAVSGADRRWRSTARLHYRGQTLGFYRADGDGVMAIEQCPVLTDEVQRLLDAVRQVLVPRLSGTGTLRLSSAPGADSGTVALSPDERPGPWAREALADLVKDERCHGAVVLNPRGQVVAEVGEPEDAFSAGGHLVPHPAGSFVQAHRWGTDRLIEAVLEAVEAHSVRSVLELYAGSGNFSLPLAAHGLEVSTIERDAAAAGRLAETARAAGWALQARAGDAERSARAIRAARDAVLIDPPRRGAAPLVKPLRESRARVLIYVSCDPATLARDTRGLVQGGAWRLASATPFDLFPHTGHLETLAVFVRPGLGHKGAP